LNGTDVIAAFKQMRGKTVSPRKGFAHAVRVIGFFLR
jgi:hypothetical protein